MIVKSSFLVLKPHYKKIANTLCMIMTSIIDLILMSIHEYCGLDTKKLDVIIVRRSTTIIRMKNLHWLFPVSSDHDTSILLETNVINCEYIVFIPRNLLTPRYSIIE